MLNKSQRKQREQFLGLWVPKEDAEAFKRLARSKGGVSEVLRRYIQQSVRRAARKAA